MVFVLLWVFLLVILPFIMPPKCSAEVLPRVPKHKKALMCLTEKIHILHELPSDTSCSTVGRGFHVDESRIHIKQDVSKQKHT